MKSMFFLFATLFLWALIPILDKKGLSGETISPEIGLAIRILAAFVAISPFLFMSPPIRDGIRTLPWRTIALFAASGIASMILSQYFYYAALREQSVVRLFPILFGGTPLISMLLAWYFLGEQLTRATFAGGILIAAGSALILF
ncbi:MAG: DMT family transporter [Candidatus Riflebacteria bacterium]|nr:DMT family transporter [Candidatus Riflebacteria bacterium]